VKNWSKLEQLPELFVRQVNPMVEADADLGAATIIERTTTKAAPNFFKLTLRSNSSRPLLYIKQKPEAIPLSKSHTHPDPPITTIYSHTSAIWQTFVSIWL
jgi:hypothetical protein